MEGADSGNWQVMTSVSGNTINTSPSFGSFIVTTAFTASYIVFESIGCFPSNMNIPSKYSFSIRFTEVIAKGTAIRITFPSVNFVQLPQSPSCFMTGGINGFASCRLDGTTYEIVTNSNYNLETILIKIEGIHNPSVTQSEDFIISAIYDS